MKSKTREKGYFIKNNGHEIRIKTHNAQSGSKLDFISINFVLKPKGSARLHLLFAGTNCASTELLLIKQVYISAYPKNLSMPMNRM